MEDQYDACFDAAVEIARKAGEMIREAFHKPKCITAKGCATDLVTETDEAVEKMIIGHLRERFPDHNFIGEESTAAGARCVFDERPTWMIDPVDGTTNFVHRFPYVAVSIGFLAKKEFVFGVIYNAPQDIMYTGRTGKGAFRNGEAISASGVQQLNQSLVLLEIGSSREAEHLDEKVRNYHNLAKHPVRSIRSLGSAALNMCAVASGEGEAYCETGMHCWDVAAGTVILREAGGYVCDPDGTELDVMSRRCLATCSENVAKEMISVAKYNAPLARDDAA
ncbi:inositol monophosphatase 1-like [Sycon ciliatum]|uniref:inositol monophosphatase 1-like n=1 Tax=Sycon ciliatum TaxID=27933 RepID=UPI0020AC0CBE|eukprot:scpid70302/ scgid27305/ Inositol monophosphatase 1; Inositol-1(or 4)-monophosphatase 1; Lithium-sensitive myo-inositol monophosphatase A1